MGGPAAHSHENLQMSYCEVCTHSISAVDIFIDQHGRELVACYTCVNRMLAGEQAENIYEEAREKARIAREKSTPVCTN